MSDPRPRIRLSANEVPAGEIVEVRTLVSHPMESGMRSDGAGSYIPRHIINTFRAEFGGEIVFEAQMEPAIAANPYFEFALRPQVSGTLVLTWIDDDRNEFSAEEEITVL
jgi:sulfur-oxidizing protein SoxZ